MDAFERFVRAGLERAGVEVDEIDLTIMRAADAVYGPQIAALGAADLAADWPELVLDPSRAPAGLEPPPRAPRAPAPAAAAERRGAGHPQDLSLREQAALVASGELDPADLLAATLERIAERDGPLNSIVATFPERSERMLAEAPPGPLHGVPISVKDEFTLPWRGPLDGMPREQLPPGESAVYRSLRDAGAVVACVTHMPFWGASSTGHLAAYGPCGNPWNPEHCSGGSSSGAAASTAARMVAGAVGADGAGSIRLPSAYCGTTGLKPTFATIAPDGDVHGYLTMGQAGPIARDAGDVRLLGEVLFGRALPARDASDLRVGIVRAPFWEDVDPAVESACRDVLAATGWDLREVELEGAEHALVCAVLLLSAEGGPSLDPADVESADRILRAVTKFSALVPAQAIVRATRVRSILRRSLARLLAEFDVLAWPSVQTPAPPIAHPSVVLPSGRAPADRGNVRQAGLANVAGTPALSLPAGFHPSGLPVGLHLLGRWGDEALLLDAAEHVERATAREFVDAVPPMAAAATA